MNLKGRQDLELINLTTGNSAIYLSQTKGPIRLVHLETGKTMLEVPKGKRSAKLLVPVGKYLLQRPAERAGETAYVMQVAVHSGEVTHISEADMRAVTTQKLRAKSFARRNVTRSTVPEGMWEIQFAIGANRAIATSYFGDFEINGQEESEPAVILSANVGLTDRLQLLLPRLAVAYRLGEEGKTEWIPWGGVVGWNYSWYSTIGSTLKGAIGAGIDGRFPIKQTSSINLSLGTTANFAWSSSGFCVSRDAPCSQRKNWISPTKWRQYAIVGYSTTIQDVVTLNVGLGVSAHLVGDFRLGVNDNRDVLLLGSIQDRGLRRLPLLQVHLNDRMSLEGHVGLQYGFQTDSWAETYLAGASWVW